MSKAGVLGHFGTKEGLQLAVLEAAIERFLDEVWRPVEHVEPGLTRLQAISEAWLSYLERGVFPGGCFLTAASTEFDGRPGVVRERVSGALRAWRTTLTREAARATSAGELPRDADPAVIAFQLGALMLGVNQAIQLFQDPASAAHGRAAIRALLRG